MQVPGSMLLAQKRCSVLYATGNNSTVMEILHGVVRVRVRDGAPEADSTSFACQEGDNRIGSPNFQECDK